MSLSFFPRAMITENDEITLSLVALFGTRKNEVCIAWSFHPWLSALCDVSHWIREMVRDCRAHWWQGMPQAASPHIQTDRSSRAETVAFPNFALDEYHPLLYTYQSMTVVVIANFHWYSPHWMRQAFHCRFCSTLPLPPIYVWTRPYDDLQQRKSIDYFHSQK